MASELQYALMAGGAYISSRPNLINRFPVPQGWSPVVQVNDEATGFEAISYFDGNEVVISYAGTNPEDVINDIIKADVAAGLGIPAQQVLQAAQYYFEVKARYPNVPISFAGHSLGGGLASLMAIYFGKTAVTFDQAPFRNSASMLVALAVKGDLLNKFPIAQFPQTSSWIEPLDRFIWSFDPYGLGFSQDGLAARETKVTGYKIEGEFLSIRYPLPVFRIGTSVPLTHGTPDFLMQVDLHSQALLVALLNDEALRSTTYQLPDLLRLVFDKSLYSNDTKAPDENFVERLIRHQFGNTPDGIAADAMLSRFTEDMSAIAQDAGLSLNNVDLTKALIAFAMQMYYENEAATDPNKKLFTKISGGLNFDTADVANSISSSKGYQYLDKYIASLSEDEQQALSGNLARLTDWYVQAGAGGMSATAGSNAALMLGGSADDNHIGGSDRDVLLGGNGADYIVGGADNDILVGGQGNDTLSGLSGSDTLKGGNGEDFILGGADDDELDGGDGADDMQGNAGNDTLTGGRDADQLDGGAGNDRLDGGAYGDKLLGGSGNDTLIGGVGDDQLDGEAGDDVIYAGTESPSDTSDTTPNQLTGGTGHDKLHGSGGKDLLLGGEGNDELSSGAGDEVMKGGDGTDTYLYAGAADGSDTIEDRDMQGSIRYAGSSLSGGTRPKDDKSFKWTSDAGVTYTTTADPNSAPTTLTITNGSGRLTVKKFVNGDLGIQLKDKDKENEPFEKPKVDRPTDGVDPGNPNYKNAKTWRVPSDPLVIDLDGDGARAAAIGQGAYFDFDGDGLRGKSGWVAPGDALLVRDRNGNGTIDNQAELYGDQTLAPNGSLANSGFAALAAEDGNHDGQVDAQDAAWNDIRLWRDDNRDGISQAAELLRPDDLGIASFGTAGTNQYAWFGGGTQKRRTGRYTRTDGSTGEIGEMQFEVSAVDTQPVTVTPVNTEQVAGLPELRGSGKVQSLWQAMSKTTPEAQALKDSLTQFAAATTRNAQLALLDTVLVAWADTSGMARTMDDRANGYAVEYLSIGREGRDRHLVSNASTVGAGSTAGRLRNADDPRIDAAYRAKIAEVNRVLHVTEAFNGEYFHQAPGALNETRSATAGMAVYGGGSAYSLNLAHDGRPVVAISLNQAQIDPLQAAYATIRESAWRSLILQTRLQGLLELVQITVDETGRETTDTALMDRELQRRIDADPVAGLGDLLDLNRYAGLDLLRSGWTLMENFDGLVRTLPDTPEVTALLNEFRVSVDGMANFHPNAGNIVVRGEGSQYIAGGYGSDWLYGGDGDDNLNGGGWHDVLVGGAGNDALYGAGSDDVLLGGAGNDVLAGEWGNDFLNGGEGDDTLSSYLGGQDTLIGGAGDDYLSGGDQTTYVFRRGDGHDAVGLGSTQGTATSVIRLEGLTADEIDVSLDQQSVVLTVRDTGDSLRINPDWGMLFFGYTPNLKHIEFADGNTWSLEEVTRYAVAPGTDGDDLILGSRFDDAITGLGGNDTMKGGLGDDRFEGGQAENDSAWRSAA